VFRDIADRREFFDKVSTMKPEGWEPGGMDAIATASADGKRVVVKAVNYRAEKSTLLVRLKGKATPLKASAMIHTITAGLNAEASLERPDAIKVTSKPMTYASEFAVELEPYTVAVVEIRAAS
jgi:alpha-N-arabinofuranosidase